MIASMMAKATVTTDDLDGSANADTVSFGYDGTSYTIDLSKKNRAAMDKALKPYLAAASKKGRAPTSRTNTSQRRNPGPDLADVRAWAANQGITVSGRGRIAQATLDAYAAAH